MVNPTFLESAWSAAEAYLNAGRPEIMNDVVIPAAELSGGVLVVAAVIRLLGWLIYRDAKSQYDPSNELEPYRSIGISSRWQNKYINEMNALIVEGYREEFVMRWVSTLLVLIFFVGGIWGIFIWKFLSDTQRLYSPEHILSDYYQTKIPTTLVLQSKHYETFSPSLSINTSPPTEDEDRGFQEYLGFVGYRLVGGKPDTLEVDIEPAADPLSVEVSITIEEGDRLPDARGGFPDFASLGKQFHSSWESSRLSNFQEAHLSRSADGRMQVIFPFAELMAQPVRRDNPFQWVGDVNVRIDYRRSSNFLNQEPSEAPPDVVMVKRRPGKSSQDEGNGKQ